MHPPGKENATRRGGALKTTYDKRKVAHPAGDGQLIPDLVLDFQSSNVEHVYRPNAREVVVSCPFCPGGRLFFSVVQPWHVHLDGDLYCRVRAMTFKAVVEALVEKAGGR